MISSGPSPSCRRAQRVGRSDDWSAEAPDRARPACETAPRRGRSGSSGCSPADRTPSWWRLRRGGRARGTGSGGLVHTAPRALRKDSCGNRTPLAPQCRSRCWKSCSVMPCGCSPAGASTRRSTTLTTRTRSSGAILASSDAARHRRGSVTQLGQAVLDGAAVAQPGQEPGHHRNADLVSPVGLISLFEEGPPVRQRGRISAHRGR